MKLSVLKISFCLVFWGLIIFIPLLSRATEGSYSQLPIPGFSGFSDPPTIGELFNFAYGLALLLSGIFLFISLFSVGWGFLTSGANPQKRRDATKKFTSAAAGTALLLGTFLVLRIVNPQLLTLSNQNFSVCYTPTAQELAQPPAVQKDDEKNRIAAGLPPNCTHIKGPSISLFAPFGSASSPASSSGSSSGTTPPTSSTGGTCSLASADTLCAPSALQAAFEGSANQASEICNKESGADPTDLNAHCFKAVAGAQGVGVTPDYDVGLFQLNLIAGSGRCPAGIIALSSPDSQGNLCQFKNKGALITCAATYGVALDFPPDHPYGIIAKGTNTNGDTTNSATQIMQAKSMWEDNGKTFCRPGTDSDGNPVCTLWSSAKTCNIP